MKVLKWIIIGIIIGIVAYLGYETYLEYQISQQLTQAVTAEAKAIVERKQLEPQRQVERTQQVIKSQAIKICREGEPCPDSGPERIIERIIEREVCANRDTSLEFDAMIVKLKMQNESSWMSIMKLLVAMLAAVFGIKFINLLFKRWEL